MKPKSLPPVFATLTTSPSLGKEWNTNRLCQSDKAREVGKHVEWRILLMLTASFELQFPGSVAAGPVPHSASRDSIQEQQQWWYKAQDLCGGTKHRTSVVAVVVVPTVLVL